MAKHASKPKQRRKAPGAAVYDLDVQTSDEEQLEDDFRSGKDKVSLTPHAEEDSDLGLDEEGVYDLSEEEDEDEDEDDEEEEGDEELVEAALAQGGKLAQIARQAKYLGEQLKRQRGLEEDEEGEEGGEGGPEAGLAGWGANKRAYYDADEAEEEEDAEAEEAEAARLQAAQAAALAPDDYGLDEDTLAAAAERRSSAAAAGPRPAGGAGGVGGGRGVTVEAVTKDLSALTSEEQMAVLTADAPELLGLLGELTTALDEVRHKVGPLLAEVRAGGLATAGGLSYLEAKHLLLLQYCSCLVVYLLLKAEGKSVKDHPVIGRLVQLRSYLERVRPIDKQLAYQLDKLLRATALARTQDPEAAGGSGGAAAAADELAARPNPAALVAKAPLVAQADVEGGAGGVYRPPKLNPVAMEGDAELSRQERRRLKEAARKAQRSSLVRDLAAELAGAPEEAGAGGALGPGLEDSAAAVAAAQRLAARSAAEEELMTRVPLSKAEAKKLRAARRAGLSGGGLLDDFADEVADLVASAAGGPAGAGGSAAGAPGGSASLADLFTRQRLSQKFGADLLAPGQQQQQHRSGDADLPQRPSLGERRAAYDAVAARRAAAQQPEDDDMEGADEEFFGGGAGRKRGRGEEDEFYSEAAASRAASKAARKGKYAAAALAPPLPDPEVLGQRAINTAILKNRGLTPHRRKDLKNPRKKNRIKFAQASTRRKGQVQGVRPAQGAGYGGEATGIKAKVAKSTRLG